MPILALDFDGVLCDSVDETGISGWKTGGVIWEEMSAEKPPVELLAGFRHARPVIEKGHEAVLLMRLLLDGEDPERLLADFPDRAPAVLERSGLDADSLKTLFGSTRDRWRASAPGEWLAASPFYPGVADWLNARPGDPDRFIVTTKEERFVAHLFLGNGIDFPAEQVFGLDRGEPKEARLRTLAERDTERKVCFIEDRLATLHRCQGRAELASIALYLAGWGYNTEQEREEARRQSIPVLTLADLLRL